jgi:putative ABC transport system permease protein
MISVMNTNFANVFLNEDTKGGFDVRVLANPNNPIDDMEAAIAEAGLDGDRVTGIGEVRTAFGFEVEVSNRDGLGDRGEDGEPLPYLRVNLHGVDDGFIETQAIPTQKRAAGYGSDEEVWQALRDDPTLAVLPAAVTAAEDPFAAPGFEDILRLDPLEDDFEPFPLEIRNASTGETRTVTVIAQAEESPGIFWTGIIVGRELVVELFPASQGQEFYIQVAGNVDSVEFARELESSLLTASVESLDEFLDEQQALQNGFLLVFQGFMGLGLIVGIAALGVVASRSVVERRQQIGMLRAIGYQRSMVALSFIFESTFIALSGILLGLVLGLALAWALFTSGDIGEEAEGVAFVVPWVQVSVIAGIAFFSSLFMTFLPARAASRVAVAEALRYE